MTLTTTTEISTSDIAIAIDGVLTTVTGEDYTVWADRTALLLFTPGIPANAIIHHAELSLASANTQLGGDRLGVLATAAPGGLTAADLTAPVSGDTIPTGVLASGRYVTWDITAQIAALPALPDWSAYSGIRIHHIRTESRSRSIHTHHTTAGFPPRLTVTWEPAPDPEQTYRIIGPAGLENVRLVGITTDGGLVPVRLAGAWDGTSVSPLT